MAKVKVKATIEDANHSRGDVVTNGEYILIVTSSNTAYMSGVVIQSNTPKAPDFSYQNGLNQSDFRKFRGTISLIQE